MLVASKWCEYEILTVVTTNLVVSFEVEKSWHKNFGEVRLAL